MLADCKEEDWRGGYDAGMSVKTRAIPFDDTVFSRTSLDGKDIRRTRPGDDLTEAAFS